MNPKPGTDALVIQSEMSSSVRINRWSYLNVRGGYYIYVGGALGPGGVLARDSRHCRVLKTKHWHIDYLRELTNLDSVWYRYSPNRFEHHWTDALATRIGIEPIKGFGCSDCKCQSHLFSLPREPKLAEFIAAVASPVNRWFCEHAD